MKKITVPHLVMMISGAVILLFSFFNLFEFGDEGRSAWGGGYFPLATYVVLFAVIVAGTLALQVFAGVKLPEPILGFSWLQIRLALAFFAALQMFGYLIIEKNGLDFGVGFWFLFLGAAGLLTGAILERTMGEAKTVVLGGSGPSAPTSPPGPAGPPDGGTPPPPPPPPPA